MVILIRIFSSFGDPIKAKETYIRLCEMETDPDFSSKYDFTDGEDYTHAIILNTAMPDLKIPKTNVLGLAFEPPEYLGLSTQFIEYAEKHIGKYYIGNVLVGTYHLPEPFVEHFSFMWHTPRKSIKPKTKKASIIFSEKYQAPGHVYRLRLIEKILNSPFPVDIYGYGCKLLRNLRIKDERIKGEFTGTEPFDDYQFHISIENYRHPCYVSEKFMDPVLCGCIPVYLGAYKIDELFPNTCIPLSGDLEKDFVMLYSILNSKSGTVLKPSPYPDYLKLNNHVKELFLN